MRFFLLIILCLSSILTSCQNKWLNQDELSNKFNKDWCDCMEKQSEGKTPEEIVSQLAVECMLNLLKDKQLNENIRAIVATKGYENTLSDYEKAKLFGKELGRNLMTNAVDDCVVYRQALIQFKKYYAEKAKQEMGFEDKIGIDELIKNMQLHLAEIDINQVDNPQTKTQISSYYALLGLLYENTDRNTLAVEQYDKALRIDPENTNAIVFKKLLVKYKNN